jgi:hypothetical protein
MEENCLVNRLTFFVAQFVSQSISNGKIEPLLWLTPFIPRKNNEGKILKK